MGGFQDIAPILSILLEKKKDLLCPSVLSELIHKFWYNAVKMVGIILRVK